MTPLPASLTGDPRQRTIRSVDRWLRALPASTYDVRVVPADGLGPVLQRQLTAERLLSAVPWLRAKNAQHHHIYSRPIAARHVLVDDLDPDTLSSLMAIHRPAAVVETSPWCYQAWLTISEEPVAPALAAAAARHLARQFDADAGAASAVQLGRLPGFTNRKLRHERGDGSFPYVLLRRADDCLDPASPELLAACVADCASAAARRPDEMQVPTARDRPSPHPRLFMRMPEAEYRECQSRIETSLPAGTSLDRSRVDFAVACRLLARGAAAAYARAVLSAGPRARELAAYGAAGYVDRTVAAAAAHIAVAAGHHCVADHSLPGYAERKR